MTTPWIVMNVLSLEETTIIAEEKETELIEWIEEALGFNVVEVPCRAVST